MRSIFYQTKYIVNCSHYNYSCEKKFKLFNIQIKTINNIPHIREHFQKVYR